MREWIQGLSEEAYIMLLIGITIAAIVAINMVSFARESAPVALLPDTVPSTPESDTASIVAAPVQEPAPETPDREPEQAPETAEIAATQEEAE
jgi:hypothetical protein